MATISEITKYLESIAPLALQESYDNAGLMVGYPETQVTGILVTLDFTEEVVREAIAMGANLIIGHHPIIFSGLKKITGQSYVERTVMMAIQHNIALYASHTNLDSILQDGVNSKISQKLSLTHCSILSPAKGLLKKMAVFAPESHATQIREAMFEAGAGNIGQYSHCSFNANGTGTFKASSGAKPFVGQIEKLHNEPEVRIEVVLPSYLTHSIITAMLKVHPYQEVAYDLYSIENQWNQVGAGMVGEFENPLPVFEILQTIKNIFNCGAIKHTASENRLIKKVAFCGGSGIFLLKDAIKAGAQLFITSDVKYHQFFDAENRIVLADIGHYESEQYTKELFYELLTNKFSTFAVHLSKVNTNPIKYV